VLTFEALRSRFEADEKARFAGDFERGEARLVRAVRGVGWGGADIADAQEVAAYLESVLDACVSGHRDLPTLFRDVADVLRHAGPRPGGLLPPIAAYLPAAQAIIARYAADEG